MTIRYVEVFEERPEFLRHAPKSDLKHLGLNIHVASFKNVTNVRAKFFLSVSSVSLCVNTLRGGWGSQERNQQTWQKIE
jgi:hypothetical protein